MPTEDMFALSVWQISRHTALIQNSIIGTYCHIPCACNCLAERDGSRQKIESEKTRHLKTSQMDCMNHSYSKNEIQNELRMALETCQSCWYLNGRDNPEISLTSRRRESLV